MRDVSLLYVWPFAVCFLASSLPPSAVAEEKVPLHERIDRLIEKAAKTPIPPPAPDGEFLRRVYLDLKGVIPSVKEAREFLAEKSPDKRAKLIGQLLTGPEYPRRMRELFNVMLMERMGVSEDWNRYLETSFGKNKPWDQLSREILRGEEGDDKSLQGVPFFYTKRLEKYGQNPTDRDGLARDIGRLFLGVDLRCANCHSHLFIDDYNQADYQGLFAFIAGTSLRTINGRPGLTETLMKKKLEFVSVFEPGQKSTGPKLPGDDEIEVPTFKKGEEFIVPPDRKKRTPGVLKFSPRRQLAQRLPRADYSLFKRNIANRLWWVMMGRGLVEPLDLHHKDNPASHPELLTLLADEFAAMKFDVKAFLRELALSKTYQRTSQMPLGNDVPRESFLIANEKGLSAEQLCRSVLQASGELARVMAVKKAVSDKTSNNGKSVATSETTTEAATFDDVQASFLKAFANPRRKPEVEFRSSVKAALFLSNSDLVLRFLEPKNGNLIDRLSKISDVNQLAKELYVSVLARPPSEEESKSVSAYLKKRADNRLQAIKNLAWALIASTEFCVNH